MNSNTGEERGEEVFGRNLCNTLLVETSYNVEDAEEAGAAGEPGAAGCASQIPSAHSPLRKFCLFFLGRLLLSDYQDQREPHRFKKI